MTLSIITAPPKWVEQAVCASADPETWFPRVGENDTVRTAKRICSTCPVRQQCLDLAIKNGERVGVWGGLTRNERRAYAKAGPTARAQIVADALQDKNIATTEGPTPADTGECGTVRGYRRHCRAKTTACDPCLEAHRQYKRAKTRGQKVSREERAAGARAARAAMVATIAELASQGVPIAEAVERAGATSLAAARAAAGRSGHADLARAIGRAEWAAKRATAGRVVS